MKDEQSLKHYGVLGMRWGMRKRAYYDSSVRTARTAKESANRQYNRDFDKASRIHLSNKKWNKDADKAAASGARLNKAEKAYKKAYKEARLKSVDHMTKLGYDKKTAERVAKLGAGKLMVQSLFMGSYGALKYNQFKTRGVKSSSAATRAILANGLNTLTLGALAGYDRRSRIKK